MKLTRAEVKIELKYIVKMHKKTHKVVSEFERVVGSNDSDICELSFEFLDDHIKRLEKNTKLDKNNDIFWFIFDNNCGDNELLYDEKSIKTIDNLLDVCNIK